MEASALLERWGTGVPVGTVVWCGSGMEVVDGYKVGTKVDELSDFEISVFPIKIRDVNKVYLISAWKIIDRTLRKVLALFSNKESRK